MAFWSSATLRQHRASIVRPSDPSKPDIKNRVETAAYTLCVGDEVYISPHSTHPDGEAATKKKLQEGQAEAIPAGQFAYLLTDETVTIPYNAIGFISIKSKLKLKGLINISGFHVDPGYSGKLIFTVYNAGPAAVHIQRGQSLFMLWLADLDKDATPKDARDNEVKGSFSEIPLDILVPGPIYSMQSLSTKIKDVEENFKIFKKGWEVAGAIVLGMIIFLLRHQIAADLDLNRETLGPRIEQQSPAPQPPSPPPAATAPSQR